MIDYIEERVEIHEFEFFVGHNSGFVEELSVTKHLGCEGSAVDFQQFLPNELELPIGCELEYQQLIEIERVLHFPFREFRLSDLVLQRENRHGVSAIVDSVGIGLKGFLEFHWNQLA